MTLDIPIQTLTSLAIILASGIIASIISRRMKISNFLLLLFVGIVLQKYKEYMVGITQEFIITVSTLALIITVFEGSSHLNLKKINQYSVKILYQIFTMILFNIIVIPLILIHLFNKEVTVINIIVGCIFSIIVIATDPTTIFNITKQKSNKTVSFLEIESILNTPVIVVLPILLLNILSENMPIISTSEILSSNATTLLLQITAGIGTGILLGFFSFRLMKKFYSKQISPLALITASLLCYVLAERIGGNGIVALATMGIFFGNVKILKKENLEDFNSMLTGSLIILVFVFVGFLINLNINFEFLWKSILIFIIVLGLRILSTFINLKNDSFTIKEKLFIGLNMPKGIAAAVVILSLSFISIPLVQTEFYKIVLQLCAISIIYSLIVSTIICKYEKYFLSRNELPKVEENKNIIFNKQKINNKITNSNIRIKKKGQDSKNKNPQNNKTKLKKQNKNNQTTKVNKKFITKKKK